MTNYFQSVTTLDEAKLVYRRLAFIFHPDMKGGDKEKFQELQKQFENFKIGTEKFDGESIKFTKNYAKEFMNIIDILLTLKGLVVEVTGSFIWVSGETKTNLEAIKKIEVSTFKRRWHTTKECWYFSPADYRPFTKKTYSMDDIRAKYGSKVYNSESAQKQLN